MVMNYYIIQVVKYSTWIFLDNFNKKKFSFNEVWDFLIDNKKLCGQIMQSNWYHVGDIQGLRIAQEITPLNNNI